MLSTNCFINARDKKTFQIRAMICGKITAKYIAKYLDLSDFKASSDFKV